MIDLTANCLGLYKMKEEGLGTAVVDYSGNANHGTLSTDYDNVTSDNGRVGRCYDFNGGLQEHISYGTTLFNFESNEPWSISLWGHCRPGFGSQIVGKTTWAGSHKGYQIWQKGSDNKLHFEMAYDYNFDEYMECWTTDANLINDYNLHHIVVTYSGSRTLAGVTMYIDNVMMTTANGKLSYFDDMLPVTSIQNSSDFRIAGHSAGGRYWDGRMDCFYILDKELSADEAAFLWNGGNGTEELRNAARSLTGGSLIGNSLVGKGLV